LLPKVINSRTKQYSLKLFSNKRPKRSIPKNFKLNKMPEDKRIRKEEKEEPTNLKNYDYRYLNM